MDRLYITYIIVFLQIPIVPEKFFIAKRVVQTKLHAGHAIFQRLSHELRSGKTGGKKSEIFTSNYFYLDNNIL